MQVSDFGVKVLLLFIVISLLPTSPFTGFTYLYSAGSNPKGI